MLSGLRLHLQIPSRPPQHAGRAKAGTGDPGAGTGDPGAVTGDPGAGTCCTLPVGAAKWQLLGEQQLLALAPTLCISLCLLAALQSLCEAFQGCARTHLKFTGAAGWMEAGGVLTGVSQCLGVHAEAAAPLLWVQEL